MRFKKAIFTMMVLLIGAAPATADWQAGAIDGTGVTITNFVVNNSQRQLYFFFNTDTDSSWIKIFDGFRVDICINDDTASAADGDATADIMHLLHNLDDVAKSLNDATVLLGVTLDGTATQGGASNDCIYDVEGPRWILVDPNFTTESAYVSVIARRLNR